MSRFFIKNKYSIVQSFTHLGFFRYTQLNCLDRQNRQRDRNESENSLNIESMQTHNIDYIQYVPARKYSCVTGTQLKKVDMGNMNSKRIQAHSDSDEEECT